ncbi:hypothetical protein [Methylobacterium oxalidis]|uniref:hypothetical protein n=1 Tax=Methylobacterium oxalidis TaxID=944322 RepID=UPI0011BFE3C2|nr:hypothetical protein [Methylobacterium oxalidis]
MIIAGLLFLIGAGIGFRCDVVVLIAVAAILVLGLTILWFLLGELDISKILIIAAYLSAMQAGYILAAYLSARQDPN